ncbi:hypothetical protein [Bradyrhizobium erythrophlei]|uniref:Uncharacterized protein n=1 Tax=Bradyrhizobium erythrophlei TaxID=1437360 RepID=A0A1H4YSC6_9BRAD|nr:hypothetical protein [Bradyrhizobium erythrophlei]SED20919.1 hypothetical protein SAMN05444164_4077 [Bradyrhizobium erythrophlei]
MPVIIRMPTMLTTICMQSNESGPQGRVTCLVLLRRHGRPGHLRRRRNVSGTGQTHETAAPTNRKVPP